MKRSILSFAAGMFLLAAISVFSSCENNEHNEQINTDDHEEIYACPKHHGTTGKKGDICETCGMNLTATKSDPTHKGHNH